MRLNRLTLNNFKGIEALDLHIDGNNVTVFGENGTGKTTIADAYAWVTLGKNFLGNSIESEIKLRDPKTGLTPNDGGVIHSVEAELLLDDGTVTTIKKEYVEKWEKKRGEAESEFRGHTTNYYVNDVPLQKKEYDKKVSEFIPETAGRLLSVPLYFCTNLKWSERRKVLMEMCGTISDESIFREEEFRELGHLLKGKSVDEYRKTLKAQTKKVNEELKTIPARIDELAKMDEEKDGPTRKELESELKELKAKRAEAEAALARIENGGEIAELKKEIAGIEAQITKLKSRKDAEHAREISIAKSVITGCTAEIKRLNLECNSAQEKIQRFESINATTDRMAQDLRDEWARENEKKPTIEISDTCPCCGQPLPPEKLEEAREKELKRFNLEKSAKLAEITAKGKRMMEQRAKNVELISELKEKLKENTAKIGDLTRNQAEAQKEIDSKEVPDITDDSEYKTLDASRQEAQAKIDAFQAGENTEAIAAAKSNIESVDLEISNVNASIAAIEQAEGVKRRKAELKAREKELGKIYSDLEKALNLTERFIRRKVELTEGTINSHFKYVRFTMFRQQINGGLEECCEPTIDGVPFGEGLNTGSEMKAALDILNALSKHYGLVLPVFIDNCESYTKDSIIDVDNQIIRLIVTEGQKALAIEVEGQGKQEIEAVARTAA